MQRSEMNDYEIREKDEKKMESKKTERRSQEKSPNYEMEMQQKRKGKMDISNVVTQNSEVEETSREWFQPYK